MQSVSRGGAQLGASNTHTHTHTKHSHDIFHALPHWLSLILRLRTSVIHGNQFSICGPKTQITSPSWWNEMKRQVIA